MSQPAPQPPTEPARRRGWRRLARGAGWAAAALALLWIALHAYLNSDGVRARLLGMARDQLARRTALIELGDTLHFDWLGRVTVGPVRVKPDVDAPPFLVVDRIRVRPSYRAFLRFELGIGSIRLDGVRLDITQRGRPLLEFWANVRERPEPRTPPPPSTPAPAPRRRSGPSPFAFMMFVENLEVHAQLPRELEPVLQGARARVRVARDADEASAHATLWVSERGRIEARAVRRSSGAVELEGGLVDLPVAGWSEALWRTAPVRLTDGALDVHAKLTSPDDGASGEGVVTFALQRATAQGETLAPRPVGPLTAGFESTVRWDTGRRHFTLAQGAAWLGAERAVSVALDGELSLGPNARLRFVADAPAIDYARLLQALPPQLRPEDDAPRCEGTIAARIALQGPLLVPEQWTVEPKLDLQKLHLAEGAQFFVRQEFEHKPVDAHGRVRDLWIGRDSPTFVPLDELPEHVVRAVLTSEDAGFYGHQGFEFTEIHPTIIAAVRGTRVRGASTITQQLAKNLFLTRDKDLSRKVKEALITLALEASVPKDRLLEVYLNIIEWGPNLYGLGEAAQYYFGVDARALTPKQAAFLATIIPNPTRYHVYFARKELTPTWEERVSALLFKLHEAQILDAPTYTAALAEPLRFREEPAPEGASAPPPTPPAGRSPPAQAPPPGRDAPRSP